MAASARPQGEAAAPRARVSAGYRRVRRSPDGFLVGSAIGSGFMARASQSAGADFVLALNAGRLRNMGAPSIAAMLPVADANALTLSFARDEILTQCSVPVYLGLSVMSNAMDFDAICTQIRCWGFAGVTNFPTSIHYTQTMRDLLERCGHGFSAELELLASAQGRGLATVAYVATREQARRAAEAGIDMVCLNFGWNAGGDHGHATRVSIEEVATVAREIARLVKRLHPSCLFVLEGGPIVSSQQLATILVDDRIDGYIGGSTIDRLPLESTVADRIAGFKSVRRSQLVTHESQRELIALARGFDLIGASDAMCALYQQLFSLRNAAGPFLLVAEAGTPAQQVAELLHGGAAEPGELTVLDCHELSPAQLAYQLFGRDGSDGAPAHRGLFENTAVATVLIHGVEVIPPRLQNRLARLHELGFATPAGSRRRVHTRARVIYTSDCGIAPPGEPRLVAALAAVLRGWEIAVPPLRERSEDLDLLIPHLAAGIARRPLDRHAFTPSAFRRLLGHDWPGNDQELRSLLGRLSGLAATGPLDLETVNQALRPGMARAGRRMASERDKILDALWRCNFHRTRTAAELGISRKTLYNKIRRYGLGG